MSAPTLPERLDRIEDELALVDSTLDARPRILWQAVTEIRAQVDELRNRMEGHRKSRPWTRRPSLALFFLSVQN